MLLWVPARSQTNDLANVTIRAAHTKSIVDIAKELQQRAIKLRTGKDDDFEKSKPLMRALPTWLLTKVVKCVDPGAVLLSGAELL